MLIALYKTKKDLEKQIGNRLLFCETETVFGSQYVSTGKFCIFSDPSFIDCDRYYAIVTMKNDLIENVS
jgi:hypothetical protein